MELQKLPLEARIKIIDTAFDVIDGSAWCTGSLHRVDRQGNWEHCAIGAMTEAAVSLGYMEPMERSDPWKSLPEDYEVEMDDDEFLEPYSYRTKVDEDGNVRKYNVSEYDEISALMGWTELDAEHRAMGNSRATYNLVYSENDGKSFKAAMKVARNQTELVADDEVL